VQTVPASANAYPASSSSQSSKSVHLHPTGWCSEVAYCWQQVASTA